MFILDVTCGDLVVPGVLVSVIYTIITVIKIAVPIMLVIWGMLDLGKAVIAQKEDDIKKGQQTFIKRLVAAAIVFFVVFVVQLLVNLVGNSGATDDDLWPCVDKFVNGSK